MYNLRAVLKRVKLPISTTLAGTSFHSRMIKEKYSLLSVNFDQCNISTFPNDLHMTSHPFADLKPIERLFSELSPREKYF